MKWASRYYISTPLILFLFLVLSFFFSSLPQNVSADAVTGTAKTQGIESLTERWLRYRAIVGCYSANDVEGQDFDKIEAGTWLDRGSGRDSRVALGYLNNDAKVSCADGAFVTNSIKKIGFSSNIDSFCSMSVAKRDGKKNYANCTTGSGRFDMDGSKGDQVAAFKAAKGSKVADSKDIPYNASGAIKYWVGLKSLQKFCGGKDIGLYDSSQAGNVGEAKKKVVVNAISLATGKMERRIYSITKDQTDTVNDIWSNTGGGNGGAVSDAMIDSTDLSCSKLAQLTWDHDDAFAEFVKVYNAIEPDDIGADGALAGEDGSGATVEDTTSCAIEGIGWVVCPLTIFIGQMNDALWSVIEEFLQVQPSIFASGGDSYRTWEAIRNLANVAFVIAFMFIIYSQITGAGISNYGIKKLLPRLIISAILVNTSFWICALAVDLSNVIGGGLYSFLTGLIGFSSTNTGAGNPVNSWSSVIAWVLAGGAGTLGTVAAVSTLGTAGFFGALSLLIPGAIVVLLAFLTVMILLIARQAFVIVLIVIAPLAFVAYLLPNTNQWFDRWRKFLTTLLLLYPVVALLFGGSQLAAAVIRAADPENAWLMIASLVVTAVPLFALPALMKTAGGVMNRIGGFVNNPNRGPLDKLRKGGEQFRKNQEGRRSISAFNGNKMLGKSRFEKRARKEAIQSGIEREAGRGKNQYIAGELQSNAGFANQVAGGTPGRYGTSADPAAISRALAGAQLTINKATAEEIEAEAVIVRNMPGAVRDASGNLTGGLLHELRTNPNLSEARQAAMLQRLVKVGDPGGPDGYAQDINNAIGSSSETVRRAAADALAKDGPGYIKASDIDKIGSGDAGRLGETLESITRTNVAQGALSQEKMATSTIGDLSFAFTQSDLAGQQRLVDTAAALKSNENLKGSIKHNAQAIDNLSRAIAP